MRCAVWFIGITASGSNTRCASIHNTFGSIQSRVCISSDFLIEVDIRLIAVQKVANFAVCKCFCWFRSSGSFSIGTFCTKSSGTAAVQIVVVGNHIRIIFIYCTPNNSTNCGAGSGYGSVVITILNALESIGIYISKYAAKQSTFLICLYGSEIDAILNHYIAIGIAHNTTDAVYACVHRNAAAKCAVFYICWNTVEGGDCLANDTTNMCHCFAGFCNHQIGCNVWNITGFQLSNQSKVSIAFLDF